MLQWWCAAQGVPWTWRWQPYPGVWIFCLALIGGWFGLRGRDAGPDDGPARTWSWMAGVAALWIALDWPVGALGAGYLASVHMVQYLLIALTAPPLLLIGLPRGTYDRLDSGTTGRLLGVISHPIVAMCTFVTVMAFTHWPPIVDTLMATQLGSFTLDLLWLISGLIFWWPVAAPKPQRDWLHDGTRIGYLIVATLVNTGVFAYLTFAELPLYATYELAPPVGSLSTRDDQMVAGMLMKIGGAPIIWTAITLLFFRAYARSDSLGREEAERASAGGTDHGSGIRPALIALLAAAPLLTACGSEVGDRAPADGGPAWMDVGGLEVRNARLGQPALPDRAAGYMQIRNPGDEAVSIVSVTAETAAGASLHESSTTGGTMRMAPLDTLRIEPGATTVLEPGGIHLMLTGLSARPLAGDTLWITLVSGGGVSYRMPVPVVPLAEVGR